jgi:hypothetical protein
MVLTEEAAVRDSGYRLCKRDWIDNIARLL